MLSSLSITVLTSLVHTFWCCFNFLESKLFAGIKILQNYNRSHMKYISSRANPSKTPHRTMSLGQGPYFIKCIGKMALTWRGLRFPRKSVNILPPVLSGVKACTCCVQRYCSNTTSIVCVLYSGMTDCACFLFTVWLTLKAELRQKMSRFSISETMGRKDRIALKPQVAQILRPLKFGNKARRKLGKYWLVSQPSGSSCLLSGNGLLLVFQ